MIRSLRVSSIVSLVFVVVCRGVRIRNSNILTSIRKSSPSPNGNWISKLGEGITIKGVEVTDIIGGLRGIAATEDFADNFVSVTIPADLAIETNNNRPPTPFPDFCPQNVWSESCKWDNRLALKLLFELSVLGDKSPKVAWLEQLPKSFSTPIHWDKDEVEATQYASFLEKIESQVNDWRDFYEKWSAASGKPVAVGRINFEDFVWAMECVNSRAFSGVYEGSSAMERRSLFLFTGFLTLLWPILGLGTSEQALGAAVAVGISVITKDVFFSKLAGLKRYVMCPYIDMFNHKSTCTSDVSYGYFSDAFELRTQGYKKGEQVFISYGKQSNDRLLQYYGFVDADNPHDSYDFGAGFLDLIIKYADEIGLEAPLPSSPSPRDRLQIIASAMRATTVENLNQQGGGNPANKQKGRQSTVPGDELTTKYFRTSRSSLLDAEKKGPQIAVNTKKNNPLWVLDHYDDVTVRAMRALYASPEEWASLAKESGGQLQTLECLYKPLSWATENAVATALRALARLELDGKPTKLEDDINLMEKAQAAKVAKGAIDRSVETVKKGFGSTVVDDSGSLKTKVVSQQTTFGSGKSAPDFDPSGRFSDATFAALAFRIEKKKLLQEASILA